MHHHDFGLPPSSGGSQPRRWVTELHRKGPPSTVLRLPSLPKPTLPAPAAGLDPKRFDTAWCTERSATRRLFQWGSAQTYQGRPSSAYMKQIVVRLVSNNPYDMPARDVRRSR